MSSVSDLTPVNYSEEKQKFLSDPTFNPQFQYEASFSEEDLTKYGLPNPQLVNAAEKLLRQTFAHRNDLDLLMDEGGVLTEQEVELKFKSFLQMHGIEDKYQILWSASFVSRAAITENSVKLKSNVEFREINTIGLIYHEIGTHAIRRVNYEKQPWYKNKKAYGITHNYLRTEEGLATIHALLPKSKKSLYTTAIRYGAVAASQSGSFLDVWLYLTPFVSDLETRWMIAFRQKRGVTDTSKPGGYTKDIVYFEGAIEVLNWLAKNSFDLPSLYIGKIAWQDLEAAKQVSETELLLPSFYTLSPTRYQKQVEEIIEENSLIF
jgi:hypothetical protein